MSCRCKVKNDPIVIKTPSKCCGKKCCKNEEPIRKHDCCEKHDCCAEIIALITLLLRRNC